MIRVLVSGNTKYFQDTANPQQTAIHNYCLETAGNSLGLNVSFDFRKDAEVILRFTENELFIFAQSVKGADFNDAENFLRLQSAFILNYLPLQELALIKALFNMYIWLEYPLKATTFDPVNNPNGIFLPRVNDNIIDKYLYDEFILDYTGKVGTQKDIYLLSRNFFAGINEVIIHRLIDLNLLCTVQIVIDQFERTNYFVPLLKPGIEPGLFVSKADPSGNLTLNLWKKILNARDIKIKRFISNR